MPSYAPGLAGNTAHAFHRAGASVTLPLVVVAGSNDQFNFNGVEYLIPAGTYGSVRAVADAVNNATNDEDALASPTFSSLVVTSPSVADPTKLLFTAIASGALVDAFATGAENDGLAGLGVSNAAVLAGGSTGDGGSVVL